MGYSRSCVDGWSGDWLAISSRWNFHTRNIFVEKEKERWKERERTCSNHIEVQVCALYTDLFVRNSRSMWLKYDLRELITIWHRLITIDIYWCFSCDARASIVILVTCAISISNFNESHELVQFDRMHSSHHMPRHYKMHILKGHSLGVETIYFLRWNDFNWFPLKFNENKNRKNREEK